jgi:hypothetical protein
VVKPAFSEIAVYEKAQAASPVYVVDENEFSPIGLGFFDRGEFALFRAKRLLLRPNLKG